MEELTTFRVLPLPASTKFDEGSVKNGVKHSITGCSPDYVDTKIVVEYLDKLVHNLSWTGNFLNSSAREK